MNNEVPLVVPEVNPQAIQQNNGIIANPNCSTIQMVVVLKPLHDEATITRLVISTYQAVSGAGSDALRELETQVGRVRAVHRDEPRRIDLDIAVWNGEVVDPDVHERAFLRAAVLDVLPDLPLHHPPEP